MPYLYKISHIQCRGSAGCIYIENMFKSFILVDHSDLCNIVTVKEIGKKSIKTIKWNKNERSVCSFTFAHAEEMSCLSLCVIYMGKWIDMFVSKFNFKT